MSTGPLRRESRLRRWARKLKQETVVLYVSYADGRTPWHAKLVAAMVVAYALSPIDLIPDPIPVLGYLDDLLLLPLGIWLALRLIPEEVIQDARAAAERGEAALPSGGRGAAVVIALLWVAGLAALAVFAARLFQR